MSEFGELLGYNQIKTLEFFTINLADVVSPKLSRQEVLYVASILAHYAQVSTLSDSEFPAPRNLTDVFDNFILGNSYIAEDPLLLENAGSQTLLCNGFLRDQMMSRHYVGWYDEIGSGFFKRAGYHYQTVRPRRSDLMMKMAVNFRICAEGCCKLSRELRDSRFILPSFRSPNPPS